MSNRWNPYTMNGTAFKLRVKSRHCVQRKVAVEHCLDSMHVKNKVKILVFANKAQS